jgi:hypothetical protein
MRRPNRVSMAMAILAPLAIPGVARAALTYYIDGNTDYTTDHGCGTNIAVSDDTQGMATALAFDGWTGSRYLDVDAWPSDFTEACSSSYGSGQDYLYGDGAMVSIFSGHANAGLLAFAYPHNSACQVELGPNARLGSMSGASAGYAFYYGCCTLQLDSLVNEANWEWTNQAFGFIDTEEDGDSDLSDFFADTYYQSNTGAWLDTLEDRPGWFTGNNSPIVVSYGPTSAAATTIQSSAALKQHTYLSPRGSGPSCGAGQPLFYYVYSYINNNNGCS